MYWVYQSRPRGPKGLGGWGTHRLGFGSVTLMLSCRIMPAVEPNTEGEWLIPPQRGVAILGVWGREEPVASDFLAWVRTRLPPPARRPPNLEKMWKNHQKWDERGQGVSVWADTSSGGSYSLQEPSGMPPAP